MNSKLKITLIIGIIVLVCGVAVHAAGYMSGGMKTLMFLPDGPRAVNTDGSGRIEKVDQTFEGVSVISLDVESLGSVTIKEGPALSVKGQVPLDLGGLKAELGPDGTLTVGHSAKMEGSFIINLPDIFGARKLHHSFVEITVPGGVSLSAITCDVAFGDVSVGGVSAGAIIVESESGHVEVDGLACGSFNAHSSYGDVDVSNVGAQEAAVYSESGSVAITGLAAPGGLIVDSSYGDVRLDEVDAGASKVNMNSGDFTADTVSIAGGLDIRSDYGNVEIDGAISGDSSVTSMSGDVHLLLSGMEDEYFTSVKSDAGETFIGGRQFGGSIGGYTEKGAQTAPNRIEINSNYGDVRVDFRG
ncbi:MAG: DUF4097 domain-containing protein [Clostridiales Family XIII bacterium]|jgi:hypothetical protein|nr:DUF4097 domain-containing protein [Clostridiales Family XIII bacterium]